MALGTVASSPSLGSVAVERHAARGDECPRAGRKGSAAGEVVLDREFVPEDGSTQRCPVQVGQALEEAAEVEHPTEEQRVHG